MAGALLIKSMDAIFEETAINGNQPYRTKNDIVLKYSESIGKGYWQRAFLPDGISIDIENNEFLNHIILEEPDDEGWPEIGFRLSGNRKLYSGEVMQGGQNFLCLSDVGRGGITEWAGNQRHLKVDINLTPEMWAMLIHQHSQYLSPHQQLPLFGAKNAPHYELRTTTPVMQSVLYQILNCPYRDFIRDIYLQSKALELVALWLGQELNYRQVKLSTVKLSPDDIERIYYAKDILITNLHHPPTLLELARQVAINQRKLKQGFRQIFGTTVFGYLHDYRMEQAKQMLTEQKLTVAQVAHAVGYSHLSHFASAFRKKFGVNPSAYRQK
ncbi:helix-turn-helix domain-containing protein [Gloeocapsopsis crepidinum LEGE 06123]|uniref:Helix-turn-helix domain-containing protein n=1 Tax=Gloeocapsopsis crepidinum LEGE 06123 TaxID=588587 RepID=A0ABR9UML0_9CHRO|nr:AraC family transcriptional regulator [Gloeocapsopsis crepidinum]MBE9189510.1 helix-turn-helix domain-containing protein [Gloeocapsopsis crepidinum LEGE 06123]